VNAASRATLAAVRERLHGFADDADPAAVRTLSEELFAVVGLLAREPVLRRHVSDASTPPDARRRLIEQVLSGKVGRPTLDVLGDAVAGRWSRPVDLVDGVEALARQAALAVAQLDGSIEEVEDELFRFGRILQAQSRLRVLLADPGAPADKRVELLDAVIGGKVRPVTEQLVRQLVAAPRGRSLENEVVALSELAAAQRDRSVAHVQTAVALSAQQESRLEQALAAIYRRQIALQVEIAPQVLGGLRIRVGDEIIDGSVASRLASVRQRLAG
jgi:F-type H+-transporting ATPase subunit delta